jgi:subtilase family serine protease
MRAFGRASWHRWLVIGIAGAAALSIGLVGSAPVASGGSTKAPFTFHPQVLTKGAITSSTPPTTTFCLSHFGVRCYGPTQIETAYNTGPLYAHGINGAGETIVIVDAFGAPTIRAELRYFDKAYGLPAPPSFRIMQFGAVKPYTPSTPTATGWAIETSLDVEYSHAIAPGANILLVETATAETLGVTGFPTIVLAENYVVNHHLGDVISQSFAAAEQTFPSPRTIKFLRTAYRAAERQGVTVLGAAGDWGPSGPENITETKYFPYRVVSWPASDPLVTAVGGTELTLNKTGKRLAPDVVWNDTTLFQSPAAGGGGVSSVFPRPSYQWGVARTVGTQRGIPDISMSASVSGSVLVYLKGIAYSGGPGRAVWALIGGTSEASPEFSGIVAMADQVAHHSLGLINPALYYLSAVRASGLVDVTQGNNSIWFTTPTTHSRVTVTGYTAGAGYDLASGVGTVTAAQFVPQLAWAATFIHSGPYAYSGNATVTS